MTFLGILVALLSPLLNANQVVKACGHHDYAPWNALQNDKIVGICADIATELYRRIDYKVDLTYVGPWKRCQKLVESGEVDVNICSLKNSQREQYSVFTTSPIALNENAIFVNAGAQSRYRTLDDLKQRMMGKVRGVSFGNEVDQFIEQQTTLFVVEDYTRLFNMLVLNRIDALIFGRVSGKYYLSNLGLEKRIVDLPEAVLIAELYLSVSKLSPHKHTINQVNGILQTADYQRWQTNLLMSYNNPAAIAGSDTDTEH